MQGQAKEAHVEADRLLQAMYTGKVGWSARERVHAAKMSAVFTSVREDSAVTAALCRLIYGPFGNRLATIEPGLERCGIAAGNTGLDALLHLARFHRHWLREPEAWQCGNADTATEISSLARHLLTRFPLTMLLDEAWFAGFGEDQEAHRQWFVHLGSGGRLEDLRFSLPMTHRAAHFFLLAPVHFSITPALRYGQVRALNGREPLAQALAESFLRERQEDESFWFTVTTFLANRPEIPISQIGPLLDYIRSRRFGTSGDISDAPEPNFSLRGRTSDSTAAHARVAGNAGAVEQERPF